jgi:hypothetical protein
MDTIVFQNCKFGNYEITYNHAIDAIEFKFNFFNLDCDLKIPASVTKLEFESNKRLALNIIRFQQCKLTFFSFRDSYRNDIRNTNEIEITDFDNLERIVAHPLDGIELEIISHRIRSISNLKINGNINKISYITDNLVSDSFIENFDQFKPYQMIISPNHTAVELLKHFQNASFSFGFIHFENEEEEFPGELFERYLPLMTTFANHPIRKQLLMLNNARTKDSIHRLKKLPNELMRIVGSFLELTPTDIRWLRKRKLVDIFGNNMIHDVVRPPHIY